MAKVEKPASVDELGELIDALAQEEPKGKSGDSWYTAQLGDLKSGKALLALDGAKQIEVVDRLVARLLTIEERRRELSKAHLGSSAEGIGLGEAAVRFGQVVRGLLRRKHAFPPATVASLLRWVDVSHHPDPYSLPLAGVAAAVENLAAGGPLGEDVKSALHAAVARLSPLTHYGDAVRKPLGRLIKLDAVEAEARIDPGEAWSDVALGDLAAMPPDRRSAWQALLVSCQKVGTGKPSAKWLTAVKPLIAAVGREDFKANLLRWFPLVDRPRTQTRPRAIQWEVLQVDSIDPHHVDLLKGLAWCAGLQTDRDLARALAALALSAYRKIPGRGPRLISLGNAVVAALGMMPGMDAVGQLAILKLKIKFIPAQKEAEKALTAAASREGLPREDIDELAVPSYGMEEVGRRVEALGDYTAELVVDGPDARLTWSKAGKPLKSAPAAVKKDHAAEVKELQAAAKDVGKMLTAQRERIDGLFLARKTWPLEAWKTRYLDHPLVGAIARRLIWTFETNGQSDAGIWLDGRIVCVDDVPLEGLGEVTKVALWHPIDRPVEEVAAWRDWFDRHRVRQPFKQAYREVYVLTDAERSTRVYSNRFAAHVLRQHQYHALCAARGWRNKLRLMVDDSYPATSRDLPEWNLRAEFWVEGISGEYGAATTESGSYLHLATDQVRFYEIGTPQREAHAGGGGYSPGWRQADAEPVPLDQIPPLVLSEVFRDVDLFVGVASVGNDPNWSDGGPEGRFVDYWRTYSFGDLSANGKTRKAVLERLIPRLKIAPRCSFADKFLVVRGDLRTYKIHLGSGNILMEPNDEYLCIVPKRSGEPQGDGVFLPFEGDATLSIVLSKALMLAEDKKITDPTITSQIGRR
ncbi:DUF4132 domain-containing protein [Planctomyces sp. SH-PL62]|uniref:DUF4132 domain-containing protein n=1 Tax=Planctomyces sp. SH-PL62 TaxID=1636152 RepID=UPI00078D86BC|nr:DUF4132 domain-containing protein [Planctomyces sp. SH-PL62]AMV38321.1 hypothetical protein VT85_12850 [Planctomyces sp. SH-PL62]